MAPSGWPGRTCCSATRRRCRRRRPSIAWRGCCSASPSETRSGTRPRAARPAGDLRLAEDGGDDEEGETPRSAQSGLDLHLHAGRVQPRADTQPDRGSGVKRAWTNGGCGDSVQTELLQAVLEVATSPRQPARFAGAPAPRSGVRVGLQRTRGDRSRRGGHRRRSAGRPRRSAAHCARRPDHGWRARGRRRGPGWPRPRG